MFGFDTFKQFGQDGVTAVRHLAAKYWLLDCGNMNSIEQPTAVASFYKESGR